MAFDDLITYQGAISAGDEGTANLMNSCYLQRDVYANIPDPGNAGVSFLSTDGPAGAGGGDYLYLDNGTSWDGLGYLVNASAQTFAGVKTFSSIPELPASDPTTANQAVRKSYVDAEVATGMVLAGANNTEATTTSTTTADLLTVSGLSILATTPFMVMVMVRKSAGAAGVSEFDLKLNSTQVFNSRALTSATNQAENGLLLCHFGPRVTNYLRCGFAQYMVYQAGSSGAVGTMQAYEMQTNAPTATITSVTLMASSSSGSITTAADEMRVYTFPI